MSILSTELRIGNLVSENVLGISKVVGIIKSAAFLSNSPKSHYTIELKNINPIPLTPEILEKCGFVYCTNVDEDDLYIKDNFRLEHMEFSSVENDGFYFYREYMDELNVITLHQLQNLYWCLCGEELIIKL